MKRVLCSLPALFALYYVFINPRPVHENEIVAVAPEGKVALRYDRVRVDRQDRAFVISGSGEKGRAQLLIRNNLRGADAYHKLQEMAPAERTLLTVLVPEEQPDLDLVIHPGFRFEVERRSNYLALVWGRLLWLLAGLGASLLLWRALRR